MRARLLIARLSRGALDRAGTRCQLGQSASRRGRAAKRVKPGIWRRKNAKGHWTYEIIYRDSDGRQRRQVVPGKLRDAETRLAETKAKLGKGERVAPNPRLTLALAADEWIKAKAPNLTEKTLTTYRYALDSHLLPVFGRKRLSEIDVTAVARFVARMGTAEYRREVQERNGQKPTATTGYSVSTIKSSLIPLSRTFAYATRHLGSAAPNPVTALDLDERPGYRQHKTKKPKFGRDELDLLIEAAECPWRAIIATATALGTRLGETLGLTWGCVDLDAGLISIEQQANAKRQLARLKTETSCRRIEAPDWLLSMLRELKLRSPYSAEGISSSARPRASRTRTATSWGRGLYPALKRAGLSQTSFHSLRHSHASLWIKDGGDVITLPKRLGHATPQVTMTTYADEIEEANDNAIRKARVNALFGGTKMAARLAATDGETLRQPVTSETAEIVSLASVRDTSQDAATAAG